MTKNNQTNFIVAMPTLQELEMMQIIAKKAHESKLYTKNFSDETAILMVLLAARELQIGMIDALNNGIRNIQGNIEISPRTMRMMILRCGNTIVIKTLNDNTCTLVGQRVDGQVYECTYTFADATKAGLTHNLPWKKYPSDMLYARCLSRLGRRHFSDAIGNAYVEGEIEVVKEKEKEKEINAKTHEIKSIEITDKESDSNVEKIGTQEITAALTYHEKTITYEQLCELEKGMEQTTDIFKKKYNNYMYEKWKVKEYAHLPENAFRTTMQGIEKNINFIKEGLKNGS